MGRINLSDEARRVLKEVIKHILAEPKRVDMTSWVSRSDCGTVGCIAGWAWLVQYPEKKRIPKDCVVLDLFRNLLGLAESGSDVYRRVVYEAYWPAEFFHALTKTNRGTRAYARVVASRIRYLLKTGI